MSATKEEANEMMLILGEVKSNYSEAARLWALRHPNGPYFSRMVFQRLLIRIRTEGILLPDHNKNKTIRRRVRDEQEAPILASIIIDPKASIRRRCLDSGVGYGTIQRILKNSSVHPYRPSIHQQLIEVDRDCRKRFCQWNDSDDNFHHQILFTDECTFKSDGTINTWNNRYWSTINPHWLQQNDNQHIWKVNVWCGVIKDRTIGPFIIEGNLNSASYSSFLENKLHDLLEEVPLILRSNMFFQQDGCPAHSSLLARNQLNLLFPNSWIGRFGPQHWPARSPDLTVLDYYLWGRIKDLVYVERPTTRDNMIVQIQSAISQISHGELLKAVDQFRLRTQMCAEANGLHFEHLL